MAKTIGNLSTKFSADPSEFLKAVEKTTQSVKGLESTMKGVKNSLSLQGLANSVSLISHAFSFAKSSVDTFLGSLTGVLDKNDNILDIAGATGIAAGQIKKLADMANIGGTSFDEFSGSMMKFGKFMAEARAGSKDPLYLDILAKIGVAKSDLSSMSNIDVLNRSSNRIDSGDAAALGTSFAMYSKEAGKVLDFIKAIHSTDLDATAKEQEHIERIDQINKAYRNLQTIIENILIESIANNKDIIISVFSAIAEKAPSIINGLGRLAKIAGLFIDVGNFFIGTEEESKKDILRWEHRHDPDFDVDNYLTEQATLEKIRKMPRTNMPTENIEYIYKGYSVESINSMNKYHKQIQDEIDKEEQDKKAAAEIKAADLMGKINKSISDETNKLDEKDNLDVLYEELSTYKDIYDIDMQILAFEMYELNNRKEALKLNDEYREVNKSILELQDKIDYESMTPSEQEIDKLREMGATYEQIAHAQEMLERSDKLKRNIEQNNKHAESFNNILKAGASPMDILVEKMIEFKDAIPDINNLIPEDQIKANKYLEDIKQEYLNNSAGSGKLANALKFGSYEEFAARRETGSSLSERQLNAAIQTEYNTRRMREVMERNQSGVEGGDIVQSIQNLA